MQAMTSVALMAVLVAAAPPGAQSPWYAQYQWALERLAAGDAAAAVSALERALALRPQAGLQVRTYGMTYVDYLPHLYFAIAHHAAGDPAVARRHLAEAERSGLAARSEAGKPLLEAYRILLGGTTVQDPPAGPSSVAPREPPGFAAFEPQPPELPPEELDEIRRRVLVRCGLDPETHLQEAPWYFHYELALELAAREDPQRSLDALIDAVERRQQPQRRARTYGMWFKDYLPYFQIARAHVELGNWECAADAIRLSEELGEVSTEDEEYPELDQLRQEVEIHLR